MSWVGNEENEGEISLKDKIRLCMNVGRACPHLRSLEDGWYCSYEAGFVRDTSLCSKWIHIVTHKGVRCDWIQEWVERFLRE